MKLSTLAAIAPLAALELCGSAVAAPQGTASIILINELRIEQPSADNDEYVELFSIPSDASLAGATYVVIGDGPFGSGTIEAVVDLGSVTTDSLGLALVTDDTFSLGTATLQAFLNFENGDNVTHMVVDGFTGALGDDLDWNDDGVLDTLPWNDVYDAVSLVGSVVPDTGNGEEHYYAGALGFNDVGPDGGLPPAHVIRCLTTLTDWRIGLWDPAIGFDSPGTFNAACNGGPTENFCEPQAPNSVDPNGGVLSLSGSASFTVNDAVLVASPVPDFVGVFLQSDMERPPFNSPIGGTVCLGGQVRRVVTLFASGNVATHALDVNDQTTIPGLFTTVGATMHYQFFHRDTVHAGGGNFTSALRVTWAP